MPRTAAARPRSLSWSRPARRTAAVTAAVVCALGTGVLGAAAAPAAHVGAGSPSSATALPKASTSTVKVATFNVLGASHTASGRGHYASFGPYPGRMKRAVKLIDAQGYDVIGFQEFQAVQYNLYVKLRGDSWGVFPTPADGNRPVQNALTWRTDVWSVVETRTFEIPYFRGRMFPNPAVLLRNNLTGREVWFINVHNPSNSKGNAQRWRDRAIDIEGALANELMTGGHDVVFTGDLNDRERAYCRLAAQSPLKAANGGAGWVGSTCQTPAKMKIDWVFVAPWMRTADYVALDKSVTRRITDHSVVSASVTLSS